MDPVTIMALIAAALPLIEQMVAFGENLVKQIESAPAAAKAGLQAMHDAHTSATVSVVKGLAAASNSVTLGQ